MNVLPADTSKKAAAEQYRILAEMDIAQRAEITFELSENARSMTRSGIRQRNPQLSESDITKEILRMILDKELFDQVFSKSGD